MDEENNLSEEEKIEQENLLLEAKIMMKGGLFGGPGSLPPEIKNQFLKNILAFENAEEKPFFEISGIKQTDYPAPSKLSDKEITHKLEEIVAILHENGADLSLVADVPDRIVYKFLVEDYLFDKENLHPIGMGGWVIDGCSGDCPSCFQLNYCEAKNDIWSPDELAAEIKKRQEENQ